MKWLHLGERMLRSSSNLNTTFTNSLFVKTIKISDDAWQGLMRLKIEHMKRSIDEVLKMLLEGGEVKK